MPMYTFQCPSCDHHVRGLYPMKDATGEHVACPECGHTGMRRRYEGGPMVVSDNDGGGGGGGYDPGCTTCCPGGSCNL